MTSASAAPVGLARERADAAPRRVTGRAEWKPLAALAELRDEWRELCRRALEPNVFYDPAFALAAAPVFGAGVGAVLVWSRAMPGAADRAVSLRGRAALRRDVDAHRLDASLCAARRAAGRPRRGGCRHRGVPRSCRGGAEAAEACDAAADRARRAVCHGARARARAPWRQGARLRRSCARAARAGRGSRGLSRSRVAQEAEGAAPPAAAARREGRGEIRIGARGRRDRARAGGLPDARGGRLERPRRHAPRGRTPTCCISCRAQSRRSPPTAACASTG